MLQNKQVIKFIVILVVVASSTINALSQQKDMHNWYGVKLEGELHKRVAFSIEPEIRMYENGSRLRSWLTEFTLAYQLHKRCDMGALYRYQVEYDKPAYNERIHRMAVYLNFNYKIKRLRWRYRAMLQNEYKNFLSSEGGLNNYLGHRHKIVMKYNIKKSKLRPSVGMEYYFLIRPTTKSDRWVRRYIAGLDYKWSKEISLGFSYKIQDEFNVKEPWQYHIFQMGIEYQPTFLKR